MDTECTREILIRLGSERLADALLELASRVDVVSDTVKRMTSNRAENVKRFKAKLAQLRKSQRFIGWQDGSEFAGELNRMLEYLEAGVEDPKTGLDLITEFYKTDQDIFERCDDSDGSVGDVFACAACDLFAKYASGCTDKAMVVERLIDLLEHNEYGVRNAPVQAAHSFLPEESLRDLLDRLWERAHRESEHPHRARRWLIEIKSLARQMKDPALFERAQCAIHPPLSSKMRNDIAEVYLEAGDARAAITWLLEDTDRHPMDSSDRNDLLLKAYMKLGDKEKAAEIAWRIFREYRGKYTLRTLLSVIGKDKRDEVIEAETLAILSYKSLSYSDLEFLADIGKVNEAETYLFSHVDELHGDHYTSLLPLAKSMEKDSRFLAAIVIYRTLLTSILQRAVSKYYHHGVTYLKKLDGLAKKITDWQGFEDHESFKTGLRQTHSRKSGFWARYEGSADRVKIGRR